MGASLATLITRACNDGTSANVATPQANTVAIAGMAACIVHANRTSSATSDTNTTISVGVSARSA